jgi:hypothetical protein
MGPLQFHCAAVCHLTTHACNKNILTQDWQGMGPLRFHCAAVPLVAEKALTRLKARVRQGSTGWFVLATAARRHEGLRQGRQGACSSGWRSRVHSRQGQS